MTSSIKEALEYEKIIRGKVWASACLTAGEWVYLVGVFQAANEHEECSALDTFQPDGERREAIAPLRNRLADLIHQNYEPPPEGFPETEPWNGGALDIVDMIIEEILVSGLVQDEAGWRDIRTAPKEWIIGYTSWGQHVGKFHEHVGPCEYVSDHHEFTNIDFDMFPAPTHWKPWPAPLRPIRSARDGGAET